ncbi:hypothetical protein TNCV_380571 [Trichonephila clavipes]|nr:hypothetical protein TNCV_380571 [Trichonephila clavipes]
MNSGPKKPKGHVKVRIYYQRERDDGVVETDGLDGKRSGREVETEDGESSRAAQEETEGSEGLAGKKALKWSNCGVSEGSAAATNNQEWQDHSKGAPERLNL